MMSKKKTALAKGAKGAKAPAPAPAAAKRSAPPAMKGPAKKGAGKPAPFAPSPSSSDEEGDDLEMGFDSESSDEDYDETAFREVDLRGEDSDGDSEGDDDEEDELDLHGFFEPRFYGMKIPAGESVVVEADEDTSIRITQFSIGDEGGERDGQLGSNITVGRPPARRRGAARAAPPSSSARAGCLTTVAPSARSRLRLASRHDARTDLLPVG